MYEKRNFTYILTILESIEKIFIYTKEFTTPDEFYVKNEQMNFNACQVLLLVIGEESKKINEALKAEHNKVPWNLIAGLRNRIAHDYRSIDPNISFDIIQNYLSELKEQLIEMLDKVEFKKELLEKVVNTFQYSHLKYLLKEKK
jgi:uncharacterized protein with HEPN domain